METVTFDAGTLLPRIRELLPGAFYAVEDSSGVIHTDAPTMVWCISGGVVNEPIEFLMQEPAIRVVVRSDDYLDGGLRHVSDELGLHSVVLGLVSWRGST